MAQPATTAAPARAANKLKARDFATLGIFSALLFVLTMAAGALMTNPLFLMPWAPTVIALIGGPLYMVMVSKVHKTGAVLIPALVVGAIWALMGGIVVFAGLAVAGVIGEIAVAKTGYKSFAAIVVAYVLFCVGYHVGSVSVAWIVTDAFAQFAGYPPELAAMVSAVVNSPNGYLSLVGAAAGAVVGAFFGRAVLKKHFVAAGIVRK